MRLLGLRHLANRRRGRALPQHRELAIVDAPRAVFASVIDPDHAGDHLFACGVAGEPILAGDPGPRLRAALTLVHAPALHSRPAP